jgi:hypothetical protein
MPASPRGGSVTLGQPGPPASLPALPAACWELGSLDPDAAGRGGGAGGDVAGSSGAAAAAPEDEEVPPLDLALLCGRAILPGNVGLAQDAEQRRCATVCGQGWGGGYGGCCCKQEGVCAS